MSILLHIDSSPTGEASISRHLTREFVRRWRSVNPQGEVMSRDLTAIDIPVIDEAWISANLTPRESRTRDRMTVLHSRRNSPVNYCMRTNTSLVFRCITWARLPASSCGRTKSWLWGDNCHHAVRSKRDPRQKAGHLLHSSRPALRSEFRGCSEELSGAVAPNFFWRTRRQDMQFFRADGAADVRYGRIDRAAFLAPHVEAIHSLFAEALSSNYC